MKRIGGTFAIFFPLLLCLAAVAGPAMAQTMPSVFAKPKTVMVGKGAGDSGLLDLHEDGKGNLLAVGFFTKEMQLGQTKYQCKSDQSIRYFLAKFDAESKLLWLKTYMESTEDAHISAEKVETDAAGNSYVFGLFHGTANFGGQTLSTTGDSKEFLAKYNSSGIFQWAIGFDDGFYKYERDFVTDSQGNSYLLGYPANVAKISTDGEILFRTYLSGGFTPGGICLWKDRIVISTSIRGDMEIYQELADGTSVSLPAIAAREGYYYNTDAAIASLNANNGAVNWIKYVRSDASEGVKGIGVDQEGNVSALGVFSGTATFGTASPKPIAVLPQEKAYSYVPVLMQLDANGNLRWMRSLPIEETERMSEYSICYPVSLQVEKKTGNILTTRTHCNEHLSWGVYAEVFSKEGKTAGYKTFGIQDGKNAGFWKSSCGTANFFVHLGAYSARAYFFGEGSGLTTATFDPAMQEEPAWDGSTNAFIASYTYGTTPLPNNSDAEDAEDEEGDAEEDDAAEGEEDDDDIYTPPPIRPSAGVSFVGCPTGNERVEAQNEAFEKEVLRLTNVERAKNGLGALVWQPDLARAARYHAADMSHDNYLEHDSHDLVNGELRISCRVGTRIGKFGPGSGENIAEGGQTPQGVVDMWMNSPGHRANIMRDHKSLGVGYYNDYWVQVFGD